ncbi:DNA topoisomerase 2-binding protein 1-A isoform X1 [Histomonas meleagridis]|uniref:DNA topoisomerase 2-binding protein 1-A isoform X1 n=1 Tax=Histomonas meleagridis TaxID=135588 RepID=UPI00355AB116|nr:DNA topoisomerase 2-binding protein 1-A isoform X1 [Histomonas meleagridis]KAH0804893.1 DNA topoisomerase 2-binding protein 1-A isoform X1 [Histomonas meleagridis]
MKFRSFFLMPSVSGRAQKIRDKLAKIDQNMTEDEKETPNSLIIGTTHDDVIYCQSKNFFFLSETVIKELSVSNLKKFPIDQEKRQLVSTCLSNHTIVLALEKKIFDKTFNQLILLGATISSDISSSVSLLITDNPSKTKALEALKFGIPIVTTRWVNYIYEEQKLLPYSPFLLPPFTSCNVTSTDLPSKVRNELKKLVEDNGGDWSIGLTDGSTTYLISSSLASTSKIAIALRSNIPIVRPEWIYQIAAHKSGPIEPYLINWWAMGKNKSNLFSDLVFSIQFSVTDDIALFEELIEIHSGKIGQNPTHKIVPFFFRPVESDSIYVTPSWLYACVESKKLIDPESYPLYQPMKKPVFEGFTLSLYQLDDQTRAKSADLIRALGGTVLYKVCKNANFVVTSKITSKLEKSVKTIPIVNPNFLVQAAKTGEIPEPKKFSALNVSKLCQIIQNFDSSNLVDIDNKYLSIEDLETSSQIPIIVSGNEMRSDVSYDTNQSVLLLSQNLTSDPLLDCIQSSAE